MKRLIQSFVSALLFCVYGALAHAYDITLAWNPNNPVPDGYMIYQRLEGQAYDYEWPIWTGSETTLDVNGLEDNATYCFVARAFLGDQQSSDSNEVCVDTSTSSDDGTDNGNGGDNDTNNGNDINTLSSSGGGGGCFVRAIIQ